MSQISVAAGAAPAFLSKNYINGDGPTVVTSGDDYKHRAYDMVRASAWTSAGSSQGDSQTYDQRLFEGGGQVSRSVDFVAILGHNLQRFIVQYSANDGGSWTTFAGSDYTGSDYSGADLLLSLAAPVTMNRIRIVATHVQSATEKSIGDFVVGLGTFQPDRGMSEYERSPRSIEKRLEMADGSIDTTNIYRADAGHIFEDVSFGFRGISNADRTSFRDLLAGDGPYLMIPEPGDQQGEVFIGRIIRDSYRERYSSMDRSTGWTLAFGVEEVGGS